MGLQYGMYGMVWCGMLMGVSSAADPAFRLHVIGTPEGRNFGQTSAVDVDRDGDLDFISGTQQGTLSWFEFERPDRWIEHRLGTGARTDVAGVAWDVDRDGWVDQVSGGTWFRNPGQPREARNWDRFETGAIPAHDHLLVDVNGDGRGDLVSILDRAGVFWYEIPANPQSTWPAVQLLGRTDPPCHGGIAGGDIDGDGDIDISRVDRWLENADRAGQVWIERPLAPFGKIGPWGIQTRAHLVDLDGDNDLDLVQAEGDVLDGRLAWFENEDGRGRGWTMWLIKPEGHQQDFHSLCVADFDNDQDADIFTGGGPLTNGTPRWFLFENQHGGKWKEHVVMENEQTHESVAADVDRDGDIDILTKPWRGNRHLFFENLRN